MTEKLHQPTPPEPVQNNLLFNLRINPGKTNLNKISPVSGSAMGSFEPDVIRAIIPNFFLYLYI